MSLNKGNINLIKSAACLTKDRVSKSSYKQLATIFCSLFSDAFSGSDYSYTVEWKDET
jgi:hypothetical protein